MSSYYKPHRNPNWNYGGKQFRLSRSKIDLFLNCPKCFYMDNRLGVARPPGYPFNLNSAVDELLKKEFDIHRAEQTAHPLMEAYGIDAVPFHHVQLDAWRDSLRHGVQYTHPATGLIVRGGIDDVWKGGDGKLIVVDYKATSKNGEVSLDADWQIGYKRQMEVYQWLFRRNEFETSDTGYFVYANADTDKDAFDAKLEFDIKVIPYIGDDSWVEPTLLNLKKCLDDPRVPKASPDCDYCTYREAAGSVLMDNKKARLETAVPDVEDTKIAAKPKKKTDSLF